MSLLLHKVSVGDELMRVGHPKEVFKVMYIGKFGMTLMNTYNKHEAWQNTHISKDLAMSKLKYRELEL